MFANFRVRTLLVVGVRKKLIATRDSALFGVYGTETP